MRKRLLAYYPNDLRLKLIAHDCLIAAQAGQYNFERQARRGEDLAALSCLARFSEATTHAVYALSRRYAPFYKWTPRGLSTLGPVGLAMREKLDAALAAWRAGRRGELPHRGRHASRGRPHGSRYCLRDLRRASTRAEPWASAVREKSEAALSKAVRASSGFTGRPDSRISSTSP